MVPERDADAIAEKLDYLTQHPERWPEMGRAGRDYVEQHFELNHLNDQLVSRYRAMSQNSDGLERSLSQTPVGFSDRPIHLGVEND